MYEWMILPSTQCKRKHRTVPSVRKVMFGCFLKASNRTETVGVTLNSLQNIEHYPLRSKNKPMSYHSIKQDKLQK